MKTNTNIIALYFLISLTSIFLSSCDFSRVPLSPPRNIPLDPRLQGIWIDMNDTAITDADKIHIYRFNEHEYLIEYETESFQSPDILRFRAYPTTIGDATFANLQYVGHGVEPVFNFYRYALLDDKTLKVQTIKTSYYKDPLFSSSKKLSAFIRKHLNDPEIYEQESILVKMEQ